jgi:hypothetical protein
MLLLSLFACSSPGEKTTKVVIPYQFVDHRRETEDGLFNQMDLYAYSKELNIDTLTAFCRMKKESFTDTRGTFYYVVIFNDPSNAVFPKNPFTAHYGLDEDGAMKNIRAMYEYNRFNGYSKLTIFEKPGNPLDI